MSSESSDDEYRKALRFDWLTNFYDPLIRWFLRETYFKRKLIALADIHRGHRVLDVGCGTATLTMMVEQQHPGTDVCGIDGDSKIIAVAERKIKRQGSSVQVKQALADNLPFPDGHFDRAISSLVLHHLSSETRRKAMREIMRVLRPGGMFCVADFGKPQNMCMRMAVLSVQCLDGFALTADNVEGRIPAYFEEAGFQRVHQADAIATILGTIALYRGDKAT